MYVLTSSAHLKLQLGGHPEFQYFLELGFLGIFNMFFFRDCFLGDLFHLETLCSWTNGGVIRGIPLGSVFMAPKKGGVRQYESSDFKPGVEVSTQARLPANGRERRSHAPSAGDFFSDKALGASSDI